MTQSRNLIVSGATQWEVQSLRVVPMANRYFLHIFLRQLSCLLGDERRVCIDVYLSVTMESLRHDGCVTCGGISRDKTP